MAEGDNRLKTFRREMCGVFLDQAQLRAWDRVLAVQSRGGWAAEEACRRLIRGFVCGLDISPRETEVASNMRGIPGHLEFKVWDGQQFPFPDRSFDAVLSVFAFDRYPDPLAVLREMYRVLQPGGRLYLLEPDRMSFRGLYTIWDYCLRIADHGHLRYYPARELLQLMQQAGFANRKEIFRFERLRSGGKLLASAVTFHGQRGIDWARAPQGA
jgi:ubiquinone/menaquinone biosynthesis C-methylase UbiE